MSRKFRILLVCIFNKNYGDSVIADCTEFLIKKALGSRAEQYVILRYSMTSDDTEQVGHADAVIFAGGGIIKFRQEEFYRYTADIIAAAEAQGVPVFFNAVGVEGFDGEDERCRLLKDALCSSCVRGISVRDDLGLLRSSYINGRTVRSRAVFDPAVWTAETYGYSRRNGGGMLIGLGVARDRLFADYGNEEIDREYLLEYWKETAKALELGGYEWKIFTNGLSSDEKFAREVLEYIGHGEKLPQPANARELVKNISGFDGIAAARMHANIIAFSLGIPSISLVWNDKVRLWNERIGYRQRAIECDRLKAEETVKALERALREGCRRLGYFKKTAVAAELKRFIKKECVLRDTQDCRLDLSGRIIETGMGGAAYKYKALNCVEELERRYRQGSRLFEADIRTASDARAVCINGWTEKNLRLLGRELNEENKNGMPYDEFERCCYDGKYPAAVFDELAKKLLYHKGAKIILDVGKPPKKLTRPLFEDMAAVLRKYLIGTDRVMIRLQRESDVRLWREQGYDCSIVYFLPGGEAEQSRAVELCKKEDIKLISVSAGDFNGETARLLSENGLKPVVFSYEKTGDVIRALEMGAYMVGSFFYSAAYIEELYTSSL